MKNGLIQALILTAVMYAALGGYLLVLYWRGADARFVTHLPIDDAIPFQPAWIWIYLMPYAVAPFVVGAMRPTVFRWFITRSLVVAAISLVVFIAMPTQIAPRFDHSLPEGPTRWLYERMIAIDDPPANAAPSLHISLATLLAIALLIDFPKAWPAMVVGIGAIWLATLFTRQHHLIDVGTGAGLALAVAWLCPYRAK